MNRPPYSFVAAALALGWAGASGALPAVAPPPTGGTISIAVNAIEGADGAPTAAFVNATGEALAGRGFTILDDPGHAAFVAELTLSRVEVGTSSAKVRAGGSSILPGASAGVGAGVVIPLSRGETRLVPLQRIRLDVNIRKRGEDGVVWHGAAMTIRAVGTRKGTDDVIASDLSQAVLRSYPAAAEGVVGVP